VISTRDVEEAEERETTTAVMTSVPVSVWRVKVSVVVADVPGPMMREDGSVEVAESRVVELVGVTGYADGVTARE
jgi:hypothetical protein